jgi:predicted nucleic acid-binding protein
VRALLDANVLYPTVMRELLLAVAARGAFRPLWSARLLEEWARAAAKLGPAGEAQARGEIALLRAAWPEAEIAPGASLEARLWLPDPSDIHVLAAAIAGSADVIVTMNAADFPRGVLAEEGVSRADPDAFLLGLWKADPVLVAEAAEAVRARAEALSENGPWEMRALLKKARLPRLGKALA